MVPLRAMQAVAAVTSAVLLTACSVTFTTEDSNDGNGGTAPTPAARSTVHGSTVIGSGTVVAEERPVSDFDAVALRGIGELRIEFTGEESLSIEAEDNILPVLESQVSANELLLGPRAGIGITANEPIVYRLNVAELSAISVSGSAAVDAKGIVGERLTVTSSGSSDVRITGRVDRLSIDKSGSGTFSGRRLESAHARVEVSGSGDVIVNATEALNVVASGSSDVRYLGSPRVSADTSGSGSVEPAGQDSSPG